MSQTPHFWREICEKIWDRSKIIPGLVLLELKATCKKLTIWNIHLFCDQPHKWNPRRETNGTSANKFTAFCGIYPILNQLNPFRTSPLYFLRINFNIILQSTPRFSKFCPSGWPTESLLSLIHATCPVHLTLLDLFTLIVFGGEHRLWRIQIIKPPQLSRFFSISFYFLLLRSKYVLQRPFLEHPQPMYFP